MRTMSQNRSPASVLGPVAELSPYRKAQEELRYRLQDPRGLDDRLTVANVVGAQWVGLHSPASYDYLKGRITWVGVRLRPLRHELHRIELHAFLAQLLFSKCDDLLLALLQLIHDSTSML